MTETILFASVAIPVWAVFWELRKTNRLLQDAVVQRLAIADKLAKLTGEKTPL